MLIRILIVEQDADSAALHSRFVHSLAGFHVIGRARSGLEALRQLRTHRDAVDVVLLDLQLSDGSLPGLISALRSRPCPIDIIGVTQGDAGEPLRAAFALGVVQCLVRPLSYATLSRQLARYAWFRAVAAQPNMSVSQQDVDALYAILHTPSGLEPAAPKGLSGATLSLIADIMCNAGRPVTAEETARTVGLGRVTARRYLEHLADAGLVQRTPLYAGVGRPTIVYCWRRAPTEPTRSPPDHHLG
ncbi:response regulator [Streptomyces sp. NPDC048479]|uniref:response regulator n=1 Tax=Streptomyces sp. NPDC048479 TaxID=3154725 RepID=UPI003449D2CB